MLLHVANTPAGMGHHAVPCRFNALTLFVVHARHSHHLVAPVSARAGAILASPSREARWSEVRAADAAPIAAADAEAEAAATAAAPKRLAHIGWWYVRDDETARLREVAPFPAGGEAAPWNAAYIDGGGTEIRWCASEAAPHCLFGDGARHSAMPRHAENLDTGARRKRNVWGTGGPAWIPADPARMFRHADLAGYESETMPVPLEELRRQAEKYRPPR